MIDKEKTFKELFENSPIGIFIIQDRKIKVYNKKFAEIFSSKIKNKFINKDIKNFIIFESYEKIKKFSNTNKEIESFKIHLKNEDQIFSGELLINNINYLGKSAIQGNIFNVSQNEKIEKKVVQSEKFIRAILDETPIGISVRDKNGTLIFYNKAWVNIWGITKERLECYQEPKDKLVLDKKDKYLGKHIHKIRRVYSNGGSYILPDVKIENSRENKAEWITQSFYAIKDDFGKVSSVLILTVDITERKKTEIELIENKKKLQLEHERLEVTIESIGDGVITTDNVGNIYLINKRAQKITEWNVNEAVGKPLNCVYKLKKIPLENENFDFIDTTLQINKNIEKTNHYILESKQGKEYIIIENSSTIKDKENRSIGVVIVFQDISNKIKIENELQKINKLESLGVFAGGIAHDFNNFLTGVFGYISLAKAELNENSIVYEYLEFVDESLNNAKSLTKQLLSFSKAGEPFKEITNICKLVKDYSEFSLSGSNIKLNITYPQERVFSKIDRGQISQVITNLIVNAKQSMFDGGNISIIIETIKNRDKKICNLPFEKLIKISIEDQGSGISQENIKKIFEPYYTSKKYGNGLGLSICYSIIKKHNGEIEVTSTLNKGSIFTIYLPLAVEKDHLRKKVFDKKNKKKKIKILLMEDNEIVGSMMRKIIEKLGHSMTYTKNGEEAIIEYQRSSEKKPYDLVIIDLTVVDGMGGQKTIKELLKINPDIKAIVSSGYLSDPVMENYKKYGFKGRITKPYLFDNIKDIINDISL